MSQSLPLSTNLTWLNKYLIYCFTVFQFSSAQLLSHVWHFTTPRTVARQAALSITNSWSLLKLMSIESVMPTNHFNFCHHFLLLLSIFRSIRVFSSESVLRITWPKYWSFSISPSDKSSGLLAFRIDWFDLLIVQGSLKSLLQHQFYGNSAFFMDQILTSIHDYWKNHIFD